MKSMTLWMAAVAAMTCLDVSTAFAFDTTSVAPVSGSDAHVARCDVRKTDKSEPTQCRNGAELAGKGTKAPAAAKPAQPARSAPMRGRDEDDLPCTRTLCR